METISLQLGLATLQDALGGRRHRDVLRIVGAPHATVLVLAHVMIGKQMDGEG